VRFELKIASAGGVLAQQGAMRLRADCARHNQAQLEGSTQPRLLDDSQGFFAGDVKEATHGSSGNCISM